MIDKTALVAHYGKNDEQRVLYAHLLDLAVRCQTKSCPVTSNFIGHADIEGAQAMLSAACITDFCFFGGYADAERKCCVFLPDYLTADEVSADASLADICFLQAKVNRFDADEAFFSHRDCLGSLLSLGIERDLTGDLLADRGQALLIVKKKIAPFLLNELHRIGRFAVAVCPVDGVTIQPRDDSAEESCTVSSLRLDGVCSAVFHVSRTAAVDAIAGGTVTLNGADVGKPEKAVSAGDRVAFRGKGRIIVSRIDGVTKKGKIRFFFRRNR